MPQNSVPKNAAIFIAGARGMVGSAIVRRLKGSGYSNLLTPSRTELDLMKTDDVFAWLEKNTPQYIFIAAAKVGGIKANSTLPVEFLYNNLVIQNNIIQGAHLAGVQRLMFLGSSCIYPKLAPQPIKEEYLLTGALEPTNEPYAIAKIAGIKLCEAFNLQHEREYVAVMPTNLYGPNDNYDLASSHVLPALIRKAHDAKERGEAELRVWGTGTPLREFLYADDLADACVYLMETGYNGPLINVGTKYEVSIRELAALVMNEVGFTGRLVFDSSMPDGTPRKKLDSSRLFDLGWEAKTSLVEGIKLTYEYWSRTGFQTRDQAK